MITYQVFKRIFDAYTNIKDNLTIDIKDIKETGIKQKENASEMVEVLSDDILKKNQNFEETSSNIKKDNESYRKELSIKAIDYYKKIESIKDNMKT